MPTKDSTVKEGEKTLLKLETLLIICQAQGAACGRLRGLGEEEIVFATDSSQEIADRFSAGFRWDGSFVNLEELEKVREDNGGSERIIRARILEIGAAEKSSLMNLLNGSNLS